MKNTNLAILATILFLSCVINLNAKSENKTLVSYSYECWDVADQTVEAFQSANLELKHIATYEQEFRIWDAAYYACLGQ